MLIFLVMRWGAIIWVNPQTPDATRKTFSLRLATLVSAPLSTAPILEQALAEQAGIGWIGKNTMVLNRKAGSYFFWVKFLQTSAARAK